MRYLLDTNVLSELRKPPRRRAQEFNLWADGVSPVDPFLSVITLLELRSGIEKVRERDPDRAAVLDAWLTRTVVHRLVVATRHEKDSAPLGVVTENPWEPKG